MKDKFITIDNLTNLTMLINVKLLFDLTLAIIRAHFYLSHNAIQYFDREKAFFFSEQLILYTAHTMIIKFVSQFKYEFDDRSFKFVYQINLVEREIVRVDENVSTSSNQWYFTVSRRKLLTSSTDWLKMTRSFDIKDWVSRDILRSSISIVSMSNSTHDDQIDSRFSQIDIIEQNLSSAKDTFEPWEHMYNALLSHIWFDLSASSALSTKTTLFWQNEIHQRRQWYLQKNKIISDSVDFEC